MADQTVRISNMPESGSAARVAYDLMVFTRGLLPESQGDKTKRLQQIFDLYEQCHNLARGMAGDASKLT